MNKFLGVLAYEYRMSIQRKSLLVIMGIFTVFYAYLWTQMDLDYEMGSATHELLLSEAGQTIFFLNLFFPVIAGILAADRAVRDSKLLVREILRATNLKNSTYVLGKYLGVALSLFTVIVFIALAVSAFVVFLTGAPIIFVLYSLLAAVVLTGPAILFVTAFSLACPLVLPVRVYQILFTGYWYWGNFLSPQVLPTVSDTLLNASGKYSLQGLFGVQISVNTPSTTPVEAYANIAVLMLCAGLALAVMTAYINWQESRV
jgi:hypothetical protein